MNLQDRIDAAAHDFNAAILAAIQGATLEELSTLSFRPIVVNGATHTNGRTVRAPRVVSKPSAKAANGAKAAKAAKATGRLPRRSAEEIAACVDRVVALLKKEPNGMRAEHIREKLGLQTKEMPRILKQGVASKKLKSTGQKRATTYSAR